MEREAGCGEHLAVSATHTLPTPSLPLTSGKRRSHFLGEGLESLSLTLKLSVRQEDAPFLEWGPVSPPYPGNSLRTGAFPHSAPRWSSVASDASVLGPSL